jgi:hypothetical protein
LVGASSVGKKEEKLKKIHELQLRFSYRLFGMPAERTSFGALADITVTTSYRGRALLQQIQTPKESIVLTNNQTKATCPSFFKFFGCFLENNIALTFLYLRANIDIGNIRKDSKEHDKTWETNLLAGEWKNASTSKLCMSTHKPIPKKARGIH